MMHDKIRAAFPTFPASCWWPLRERFKRALPPVVTADYLQAILEVEPKTARNLVPMLRQMGLTDESGALRARANAWRVDSEYATVCREICDEIYPAALRHAAPDPARDFESAVRWFMKTTGVGTAAAKRMARFYSLVASGDPTPRPRLDRASDTSRPGRRTIPATGQPRRPAARTSANGVAAAGAASAKLFDPDLPIPPHGITVEALMIDASRSGETPVQLVVQIQLPPGATAEQIDQLVASIARHLTPLGRRGR